MCLFLSIPRVCLQFVIEAFPYHTHLLFLLFSCGTNCLGAICKLCYVVVALTTLVLFVGFAIVVALTTLVLFVGFVM